MSISQNFPEEGPTLNLNFAGSRTLDPRITFTRTQTTSNGSTYMGRDGLIKYAGPNEPRFDHRYANGEIESLGLLIEEQRTNFALRSQEFNLSPNVAVNASISPNAAIAPDGTLTADKLVEDNISSSFKRVLQGGFTVSGDYTVSFFVKEAGRYRGYIQLLGTTNASVSFNLQNGTASGIIPSRTKIEPYPNGWYRISTSNTFNASSAVSPTVYIVMLNDTGNPTYIGDGSSGLYIWGLQVEAGAFPTSYIPTEGSTKTRTHDRAYYENVDQTNWFNKTEGTVVFEHTDVPYNAATPAGYPAIGFGRTSDGGSQPSIQYYIGKNDTGAQYLVRTQSAGDSANINTTPYSTGNTGGKVGFVYKENDYVLSKDGEIEGIDSLGAVPDAYMLIFGMNVITNPTNNMNAHIKNLQYYPTRLTNSQLVSLTR